MSDTPVVPAHQPCIENGSRVLWPARRSRDTRSIAPADPPSDVALGTGVRSADGAAPGLSLVQKLRQLRSDHLVGQQAAQARAASALPTLQVVALEILDGWSFDHLSFGVEA